MARDGKVAILTERYQGHRYNSPNDITVGSQGRIYFSDPRYGPQFRRQWTDELAASFERPGVTMMVAPLRVLAEPDGLLDRIKAQGDTIKGPAWRSPAAH
jgi:sugar lactone lactonase YvrE